MKFFRQDQQFLSEVKFSQVQENEERKPHPLLAAFYQGVASWVPQLIDKRAT